MKSSRPQKSSKPQRQQAAKVQPKVKRCRVEEPQCHFSNRRSIYPQFCCVEGSLGETITKPKAKTTVLSTQSSDAKALQQIKYPNNHRGLYFEVFLKRLSFSIWLFFILLTQHQNKNFQFILRLFWNFKNQERE